ncbi:acyl-CoA dehydrogenase [Bordetella pertussis]|nr:acyl-CoA dehydrogenase [Bordetella pertussis]
MRQDAVRRLDDAGGAPGRLAVAKARASEAAALAANTAHAVHGAIGVTEEYDLQLYTRRLHGWRLAHGSEAYWHQVVGAALMGSGDGAVQFVRGL